MWSKKMSVIYLDITACMRVCVCAHTCIWGVWGSCCFLSCLFEALCSSLDLCNHEKPKRTRRESFLMQKCRMCYWYWEINSTDFSNFLRNLRVITLSRPFRLGWWETLHLVKLNTTVRIGHSGDRNRISQESMWSSWWLKVQQFCDCPA